MSGLPIRECRYLRNWCFVPAYPNEKGAEDMLLRVRTTFSNIKGIAYNATQVTLWKMTQSCVAAVLCQQAAAVCTMEKQFLVSRVFGGRNAWSGGYTCPTDRLNHFNIKVYFAYYLYCSYFLRLSDDDKILNIA